MDRQHNLRSGDVIELASSINVGTLYMFTKAKDGTPGFSEIGQEDLKILIADLQMYVVE